VNARAAAVALAVAVGLAVAALVAGCGSSGGPATPTIAPARTFRLADFRPSGPVQPCKPVELSFRILLPSGAPLTHYKRGPGPHTGIHLIVVRDDLANIIHKHPGVGPDGVLRQQLVFPAPGRYRVVVDTYPAGADLPRNFQLFTSVQVGTTPKRQPLPPYRPAVTTDGYTFTIAKLPALHAVEPVFLTVRIKDSQGRPPKLVPFYGALAHAILFRSGSLDYFHTHVCAPGAAGCTSLTRAPVGTSTTPGVMHLGLLLPVSGTWRLFLQTEIGGRLITAPFTLNVR
jgi:hypothetical protein